MSDDGKAPAAHAKAATESAAGLGGTAPMDAPTPDDVRAKRDAWSRAAGAYEHVVGVAPSAGRAHQLSGETLEAYVLRLDRDVDNWGKCMQAMTSAKGKGDGASDGVARELAIDQAKFQEIAASFKTTDRATIKERFRQKWKSGDVTGYEVCNAPTAARRRNRRRRLPPVRRPRGHPGPGRRRAGVG